MADSANTVAESNETNNSNCTGGTIQVTRADLVMTDVTPDAAEVNQGGTLSVTDTVLNQGLVSTFSGFKVGFYLHPSTGADVAINTTQPEAALAGGASYTGTVTLAILASTPPNVYHLCAKADSGNAVIETDDTNNIFCSTATVEVPEPDLIVNAISMTATTVNAGATVPVTNSVKNQGGSKAGSFVVAFHLSTDATYGGGDDHVSITTRTVSALAIGGTNAGTTYVRVPADTPPGDYHICANADDGGSVAEGDEGNNSACTATTVTVPEPDLVISGLSKSGSSVAAGGTFTISNTVKNQGGSQAAASEVGFVLSTDFVIGNGDDIPLTPNRPVAVLGVNATSAASTVVTVPGGTTPGVYHVGAIADVNGAVSESNEGNNNRLASGTIMVTP
jgi:subtilase family serine protease